MLALIVALQIYCNTHSCLVIIPGEKEWIKHENAQRFKECIRWRLPAIARSELEKCIGMRL